jgi:hypothetical protein
LRRGSCFRASANKFAFGLPIAVVSGGVSFGPWIVHWVNQRRLYSQPSKHSNHIFIRGGTPRRRAEARVHIDQLMIAVAIVAVRRRGNAVVQNYVRRGGVDLYALSACREVEQHYQDNSSGATNATTAFALLVWRSGRWQVLHRYLPRWGPAAINLRADRDGQRQPDNRLRHAQPRRHQGPRVSMAFLHCRLLAHQSTSCDADRSCRGNGFTIIGQ